jgi:putative ABC transport system permease protein
MRFQDSLRFAMTALSAYPWRSLLMLVAMSIGVASVVLLTALGEAARRYVAGEFDALGSHLLIVLPGRSETIGGAPPLTGETARDLTLDDARALMQSPSIRRVAPVNVGSGTVSRLHLERDAVILGSTAEFQTIRRFKLAQGQFLPGGDLTRAGPVCVLGDTIYRELFPHEPAVGNWLRLGDRRLRVIGVLAAQGESIGINTDEMVIVPVQIAQAIFNTASLFRILAEATDRDSVEIAKQAIVDIIRVRHEGEEDVTVITQDAVLATFDKIFLALTLSVSGIAAISLVVAGVLIMNVMLVAVSRRTAEIGLLKALGASARQISALFLLESLLLSLLGALVGVILGFGGAWGLQNLYPSLDFTPPWWAVVGAMSTALLCGLIFGVLPARRAARLDPVEALARH